MQGHNTEHVWISTQIKSFTKWVNNQLQKKNYPPIRSIVDDFCDGKTLINLLDVIYSEKIEHNKGELSDFQRRDNIDKAIRFIESKNINLVSIDADHIFSKNIKLTLGMTWILILRSISQYGNDDANIKNIRGVLLRWCRNCTKEYKNVDIKDFSSSWKDGLGFNAIIHHFAPHLVNYYSLSGKDARKNCINAFDLAEKHFEIPKLLDPEDLTESIIPDEKSVITYVSQYYIKLAVLEHKSNIEKAEDHFRQVSEWLRKNIGEYDNQAHDFLTRLQQKYEIETQLHKLLASYIKLNSKYNFYEEFLKLANLYGNLQVITNVLKGIEFKAKNDHEPSSLLSILSDSFYCFSKIKSDFFNICSKDCHSEESISSVKKCTDVLCHKYNIGDENIKIVEDDITTGQMGAFSLIMSELWKEKLNFFELLKKHKEHEQSKINTAIELFKTYDTVNTGFISGNDFKNCCFYLNLNNNHFDCGKKVAYDEYIQFVKQSFAEKNNSAGMMYGSPIN